MARGGNGAGADRRLAIVEHRVRNAPHMPKLHENAPARFVDGVCDELPAFDLLIRPDARRVLIADARRRNRCGFADDQTGGGALGVMLGHQRVRHADLARAGTRQRRHDDAVGQFKRPDLQGIKECRHGFIPSQL